MIPVFDISDRFKTDKSYREGRTQVVDYFSYEGMTLQKEGLTFISAIIDSSCHKSYNKITELLCTSQEHQVRVQEIAEQPRLVGKHSFDSRILEGCSEFEQMMALNDYVRSKKLTKVHTLTFSCGDNDFIPVKINPVTDISKKMMNVYLGTTTGDHKAPKYEEWAENDPRYNPYQEIFMKPLFGLEIPRQPHYLGSSLLKGHSFLSDHVDENWRFGTKSDEKYNDGIQDTHKRTACVELKNQSLHTNLKNQSAGYNLMGLLEVVPDDDNICIEPVFEDFFDEGNVDNLQIDIPPTKILEAIESFVMKNDDTDINEITDLMLGLKIGPSTTPVVREFVANKILDLN